MTFAQRQKARRERLKAERLLNLRLNDDGLCVREYDSLIEYYKAREVELKAYFPFESDEEIREIARCLPPGRLPPPPRREQAWETHVKHQEWLAERDKAYAEIAANAEAVRAEQLMRDAGPYYVDEERLAEINPSQLLGSWRAGLPLEDDEGDEDEE